MYICGPHDDKHNQQSTLLIFFIFQAITAGLRLEIAGSGVRVLSVQPGATKTALAAACTDKEFQEKSKFDLT
ncbi:hypothetical protein OFC08_32580, partial [Escherichia coli]|nr:hypothetical protein [Escherichia coli]